MVLVNKYEYLAGVPEYNEKGQRLLYEHGLPFSMKSKRGDVVNLKENIDGIRHRIEVEKKAGIVIIDGFSGMGKTTLAQEVAEYYEQRPLDIVNQNALGGKQFLPRAEWCAQNGRKAIIYDEAGDFNRKSTLSSFNQKLNRFFETYRAYKILVIICCPNFTSIDNSLFKLGIPRLLVNIYQKEQFNEATRHGGYGSYRAYSYIGMCRIRSKIMKYKPAVEQFAYNWVEPNFRGHFLDYHRSEELEQISLQGKRDINTENAKRINNLFSYEDLCEKLGRSDVWVKYAIKRRMLSPAEIVGKKYYFDMSTLEALKQEKKHASMVVAK